MKKHLQHIPAGDYVGVAGAAEIAGVSERTIRRLIESREIRAYRLQERVWVIPVSQAKRIRDEPSYYGRPRGS